MLGLEAAMKCGIGTASLHIGGGIVGGAIVAVNAGGDVLDPDTGRIIAGARIVEADSEGNPVTTGFADSREIMKRWAAEGPPRQQGAENTVIGVVATNAQLTKEGVTKMAQMAHDGLARSIRPAHTMFDGDTIIGLATGETPADMNLVGAFAAEAFGRAVVQAAQEAEGAGGLPAIRDLDL
jgi:L-aminopeptidase/D-esterase-like protein